MSNISEKNKLWIISGLVVFVLVAGTLSAFLLKNDSDMLIKNNKALDESTTISLDCPVGTEKVWDNCSCDYVCMDEKLANDPTRTTCARICGNSSNNVK